MKIDDRLTEAAHTLRRSLDPSPPALGDRRSRVARSRIAFALVVVALMGAGVVLLVNGAADSQEGPAIEVPTTVPRPAATVGSYEGFLSKGDWVDNQRSLGLRFEFWSETGSVPSPGRVIAQDPPPGVPLTESTVIRLRVGPADVDLPGEIPVRLSGVHPAWGYWRVVVMPPVDTAVAPPDSRSVATVLVQRERGSSHALTFDRESVLGPRATTPPAGARFPALPMFLTDFGKPDTLSFGLAPAATVAVVLTDGAGAEIGRAQLAGVDVDGDRFVVWASDALVPSGTRFRAMGPDGEVLAEAGMG